METRHNRSLAIIPHQDDDSLFMAFTLLREKPLVLFVTDSYIQAQRGDGITADQRNGEALKAMEILGCSACFGTIPDTQITREELLSLFHRFYGFDKVYAPMPYENGNPHHNLIGEVAKEVWPNVIQYATYTRTNLWMNGKTEIIPTPEELALKNRALACYRSQILLPSTKPHFLAVLGKSEWLG